MNMEQYQYLIDDPAYLLLPTCMKEFDSCKSNNQVIFNTMLRSAKNLVKCAFVSPKARWRILNKKNDLKLSCVPSMNGCFYIA